MNYYDLTVIGADEKGLAACVKHLEEAGAKIIRKADLGKKTFVYPIEKKLEGVYSAFIFSCDPENIAKLSSNLRLDNAIIRHLIIQSDEKGRTLQVDQPKEEMEEKMVREQSGDNTEATMQRERPFNPPTNRRPKVEVAPETEESKKERKKVLDEKLEEILHSQ